MAKWTDSIFNAGVPLQPTFPHRRAPEGGPGSQASAEATDDRRMARILARSRTAPGGPGVTPAANQQPAADAAAGHDRNRRPTTTAPAASQEPGGVHHYPTPIVDIQLFKYDDFQLWVTDAQGNPAAVAPVGARGSGNASVHVLFATPGSELDAQKQAAESANTPLVLGPDHPLSQQAFTNQQ